MTDIKKCPENKIYNPITKRCVLKTSKIGKTILFKDNTNNCNNININWSNNSCYIDSLLIALFNRKDKIIEELLLKVDINNFNNSKLNKYGLLIKKELIKIYKIVSHQVILKTKYTLSHLRKLINIYYKELIKIEPTKSIIDITDNWTTCQLDIYDVYRLFTIIFKIKEDVIKIKDGSSIITTGFANELPVDFTYKKKILRIKDVYPKYKLKYKLTKENKYRDENGRLKSYYYKEIELLKGNKLFINIYRNLGETKNNIKIIPENSIKLRENNFDLYLTAIIIHYGSEVEGGHYICLYKCYKDNYWYEYDDMNSNILKLGELSEIIKNSNYTSNIVGLIYSKIT